MKRVAAKDWRFNAGPYHIVQCLADWWTRPDPGRTSLWSSFAYRAHMVSILGEVAGRALGEPAKKMLCSAALEQAQLAVEYERLFVGPAAIPCPPYEAVWRKDRPKHEQGTIMGQSTSEVLKVYRDLGLRIRPEQAELADHIAIELEALGFAWASGTNGEIACGLFQRIQRWIPDFCASVACNSRLQFYRELAMISNSCFASGARWPLPAAGLSKRTARENTVRTKTESQVAQVADHERTS